MMLLHPYDCATRHGPRQAATWRLCRALRAGWADATHRLVHIPVGDDTRYEEAVRQRWGQDTLIILEHDLAPPVAAVGALERCPHPLCAWAYRLWHRRPDPLWATVWDTWPQAQKQRHPLIARLDRQIREARALYRGAMGASGFAVWTWAHRVVEDPADPVGSQRWIRTGEAWADLAALGFTKIARGVQLAVPPTWKAGPWSNLDSRIAWHLWAAGYRVHIHWPAIPHDHPPEEVSLGGA